MIRVGIIGCGFMGRNHFNQYEKMQDRARVVFLCDTDPMRAGGDWTGLGGNLADARGSKRDMTGVTPVADWRRLVESAEVDLVDVCMPTVMHRQIAVAALNAGKSVLVEKPMALSVEQCDEMIAAAAASPGRFMVAQCVRWWPEYVYLRELKEKGTYGRLNAVHLRRQAAAPDYSKDNWIVQPALSGGAVLDLHVHDVDYALQLLGMPKSVSAQGYLRAGGGLDRIHAAWRYDELPVVQIEAYWDCPSSSGYGFNMGFTAVFENAAIAWDMNQGKPLTIYRTGHDPITPEIPAADAYFGEISYLIECIERGEDPTYSTPADSRNAVKIALAEKHSAATGEPIAM